MHVSALGIHTKMYISKKDQVGMARDVCLRVVSLAR